MALTLFYIFDSMKYYIQDEKTNIYELSNTISLQILIMLTIVNSSFFEFHICSNIFIYVNNRCN